MKKILLITGIAFLFSTPLAFADCPYHHHHHYYHHQHSHLNKSHSGVENKYPTSSKGNKTTWNNEQNDELNKNQPNHHRTKKLHHPLATRHSKQTNTLE